MIDEKARAFTVRDKYGLFYAVGGFRTLDQAILMPLHEAYAVACSLTRDNSGYRVVRVERVLGEKLRRTLPLLRAKHFTLVQGSSPDPKIYAGPNFGDRPFYNGMLVESERSVHGLEKARLWEHLGDVLGALERNAAYSYHHDPSICLVGASTWNIVGVEEVRLPTTLRAVELGE
jgi:hypothetical protein